jgi:sigma54-dependent transcription regulator
MNTATETDVSWLESLQTEWTILRGCRHNVLLEGPVAATDAALRLLQPHIRGPIRWNGPQPPLNLPTGEIGALILRGIADLSAGDQTRLLVWLGGAGSRTQIVSTTERSLFALVARGLFDETLYYRLNVMLLRVGSENEAGLAADDAEPSYIDRAIALEGP